MPSINCRFPIGIGSSTGTQNTPFLNRALRAPFLSNEAQKHVEHLLGRPFSAFFGVGFTECECGFLEKAGI